MPFARIKEESEEEQHEVSTSKEEEVKEEQKVEKKLSNDNESEEKIVSVEMTEAESYQGHEEDLPSTCNAPEEEKKMEEKSPRNIFSMKQSLDDEEYGIDIDPEICAQLDYIKTHDPMTDLEKGKVCWQLLTFVPGLFFCYLPNLFDDLPIASIAYENDSRRKDAHIERLTAEITKLKNFISKRKQTYKRKRKDSGAPTRALSAYNIFVQDRFKRLSKENKVALKSTDTDAQMKRVPPASLVASAGSQWKELGAEDKQYYEEK